jgi:outer membrane receptor protein involved in Fe transport
MASWPPMVMHSGAYVRGNENNKHQQGPADPIRSNCTVAQEDPNNPGSFISVSHTCLLQRPDFNYSGKTVGYATFNFQTSYKLDKGLTLGLQVNNLFDKEYASAGRLGINPFSPSINGAIGPSGFNYNSREWQSSTFLAPGAPRAAWVTLTYDFDADK